MIASRDYVQTGMAGGFLQANHNKASALRPMQEGNSIIYYSSKELYGEAIKFFGRCMVLS